MKISRIHIKDHNQFKNLDLDLTYPLGHDKEGQPLDKVCVIGQSGTGKTTLLEEIWLNKTKEKYENNESNIHMVRSTSPIPTIKINTQFHNYNPFDSDSYDYAYFDINTPIEKKYKESLVSQHDCYSFSLSLEDNGWQKIQNAIKKHQEEKAKYVFAISKAFVNKNMELAAEYSEKLKRWEKENETPLDDLAENFLNPILKDFGLEVKTGLESLEEINQIHLVNTKLETIPYQFWSSGTKNIIARTIPLYTHKFKEAIICIDEPENSLYPDIQRKIVELYTHLAPDSQFFFATHSPIIASSFEPWEIVELKLDDEGFVYREQYWEGENHVDNYKYYPQYLRWDAILQHIFDLEDDGSELRKEMLKDFSNLDNKLKERKRKGETLSKDDGEVKELLEMGKKLGWNTKQG